MGTGVYLSLQKRSRSELARFLITRGMWLIFLEVFVMRCLGLQFNFDYRMTMLTVLWALGWAMIALAALLTLPTRWIGVIGIAMIAAHNLLIASNRPIPCGESSMRPASCLLCRVTLSSPHTR